MKETMSVEVPESVESESAVLERLLAEIADLRMTHAAFFALFEDTDPDTASRSDVVKLMKIAPVSSVAFFLLGKFTMRVAHSSAAGRDFN